MTCDECKANRAPETIPYVAHEAAMARAERSAKRLWVVILILIFMLVGTNLGWLWYESQFETAETVTQEVTQEADNGTNNFVGGDLIGETDGQNNEN